MSTPLDPPVNPGSKKDKALEMERLQDEFDLKTGRKSIPAPWHKEPRLNKSQRQALDALDPKEKKPTLYKVTPEMAAKQKEFDEAVHHRPAEGVGTWQATPPTKKERLLAWHKSLGSPQHVIDAELKALEEQEAKK